MRSLMKKTCTTMVTAAAASWMLLAAPGCGSDSTNQPPDHDAATDTGMGADTGVDTGPVDRGPPPVPTDVVAAGVRWFGRVDITNPAQPRFSWSGTGFVARFSGTSLTAQLDDHAARPRSSRPSSTARRRRPSPRRRHQTRYPLATGLAAGVHTVELYRQTEGAQGDSQLHGSDRRRRRADGSAAGPGPADRGDRRFDHLRLRRPRHAVRHRLLHHREPLGHLRGGGGARAGRRGQHHRRLGQRRASATTAATRPNTMPMVYGADADERRHAGLGLPHRAAGRRHQPRHQRHQQQQGRSGRRRSATRTSSCCRRSARTIPTR